MFHFAKWENLPTNTCCYNLCIPTKIFLAPFLWLLSQLLVKSICKCYFQRLCRILVPGTVLVSHYMWRRIKLHENTLCSIEIPNHQSLINLRIHYIENVFILPPLCLPRFRWNILPLNLNKRRIWLFHTVWCMLFFCLVDVCLEPFTISSNPFPLSTCLLVATSSRFFTWSFELTVPVQP